jgi:hypothetical protein
VGEVAGNAARMRNMYQVLFGKSEGKRLLGRPVRIFEDKIKMKTKEIGCEDVGWIHLAQDIFQWRAVVNPVMIHCI